MAVKKPGVDDNIVSFESVTDARSAPLAQHTPPQFPGSAHESLRLVKAFMDLDDPDIRRLFIELMERVAAAQPDTADRPRSRT